MTDHTNASIGEARAREVLAKHLPGCGALGKSVLSSITDAMLAFAAQPVDAPTIPAGSFTYPDGVPGTPEYEPGYTPRSSEGGDVREAMAELLALANLIERPPLDDVLLEQDVALRSARVIRVLVANLILNAHDLKRSPAIEALTPSNDEWLRCESIQDTYNLMKRRVDRALAALRAAPAVLPQGGGEVDRIATLLQAAWAKAEPNHGVTLHPVSYVATFADMARAVVADRATPPQADREGGECDPLKWLAERDNLVLGHSTEADAWQVYRASSKEVRGQGATPADAFRAAMLTAAQEQRHEG